MSTPNRIRISPENGKRILKIADTYERAGLPRSWNAIGESALTAGLPAEEKRAASVTNAVKKKTTK